MVNGINTHMKHSSGVRGLTGRSLLMKYLSHFQSHDKSCYGTTADKYLIENFDIIKDFILDNTVEMPFAGVAWELCREAFGSQQRFYAGVVSIIIGLDFEMFRDLVFKCENEHLNFIYIVNNNPYILQLISSMSVDDIEKIALCFGKQNDKYLDSYRNVMFLNGYINSSEHGDTVFIHYLWLLLSIV